METFMIDPAKIKDVIGRGGETITKIICDSSNVTEVTNVNAVKIDIEDNGQVIIYHTDQDIINKARQMIEDIVREVEPGKIYSAKVTKVDPSSDFFIVSYKDSSGTHKVKVDAYSAQIIGNVK